MYTSVISYNISFITLNLLTVIYWWTWWCKIVYLIEFTGIKPDVNLYLGARIEEFFYEKLDKKIPSRITNAELLGQYMQDAAKEFGPGTPYGSFFFFFFFIVFNQKTHRKGK